MWPMKAEARHAPTMAASVPDDEMADAQTPAAIHSIGRLASDIGREAAELRGLLDETAEASKRGVQAMATLSGQIGDITATQDKIGKVSAGGHSAIERVRHAVEGVGSEVGAVVSTLRQVSQAAQSITDVALQTRLVAFNASVEANRAGEAGRGFGVVADAVRTLAGQVESSSKEIMRSVSLLDARIDALARSIRYQEQREQQGEFHSALADVQQAVDSMSQAADSSRLVCAGLEQQVGTLATDMTQTGRALANAMKRSEAFLSGSEQLIEAVADCGVETEDTPYIEAAVDAAEQIAELLEDALHDRRISMAQLFDVNYVPIVGTQPQQHSAAFNALTDELFPAVQEHMLTLSAKVVFCIAVDRNGYVSTHNRKYNQRQRGDLVWDSANSRWRRIFNDRTGLASARNERPFLLQTYRRDMGGGNFVVMKEAAAPISVRGKHWGGLRLAFKF